MKAAIVAVLLAIMQTPAPVPRKASNDDAAGSKHVTTHAKTEQKRTTQAKSVEQPASAPTSKHDTEAIPQHNATQPIRIGELPSVSVRRDWIDRLAVTFAGALVLVGIIGVLLGLRSLRAAETAAKAASDNAAAALANARAIVNAERAWISVSTMFLHPDLLCIRGVGDPIGVEGKNQFGVWFQDVGRTPARVTQTCLVYLKIDSLGILPTEPAYLPPEQHSGLVLFPNSQSIGRVNTLRPEPILTKDEVRRIEGKRLFLYAYGYIAYRCVFDCHDCPHETRFGYVYNFPQANEPPLKGFMPAGPEAYNRAT